ncbi:ABC transporter permease subunit [Aestuariispira ectoiniformans]|uniref:ABC transporter permease subunit n=1 Tax=Aestuariispira ectoiniformans TaxID=2775080 RepID=UPI0021AEA26D|nr:ABC transporter permease subunit [Aestuariispira ectoiniformans]
MLELFKNKSVRDAAFQASFVGSLLAVVVVFVMTAHVNLEAQGITSGFGFLDRATGWKINFSLIEYSTSSPYWRAILVGALNSLFVGFISLAAATMIGVTIGVMRTSGNGMAELLGAVYVETFRNIPLLLQLFFWYALLTSLPNPKEVPLLFGGIALTGRGIFMPGLNVTGESVFLGAVALVIAAGLSLWIGAARQFSGMDTGRKKNLRRWAWLAALALAALFI